MDHQPRQTELHSFTLHESAEVHQKDNKSPRLVNDKQGSSFDSEGNKSSSSLSLSEDDVDIDGATNIMNKAAEWYNCIPISEQICHCHCQLNNGENCILQFSGEKKFYSI